MNTQKEMLTELLLSKGYILSAPDAEDHVVAELKTRACNLDQSVSTFGLRFSTYTCQILTYIDGELCRTSHTAFGGARGVPQLPTALYDLCYTGDSLTIVFENNAGIQNELRAIRNHFLDLFATTTK